MSDLGEIKICGNRNGASFKTIVRANPETGECSNSLSIGEPLTSTPTLHEPCNTDIDLENIVCVPKGHLENCPVTDIKFFSRLQEFRDFKLSPEASLYEFDYDQTKLPENWQNLEPY
jgi:hypothetical protein